MTHIQNTGQSEFLSKQNDQDDCDQTQSRSEEELRWKMNLGRTSERLDEDETKNLRPGQDREEDESTDQKPLDLRNDSDRVRLCPIHLFVFRNYFESNWRSRKSCVIKEMEPVTILALTFNTESIKLCGSFVRTHKCLPADFWPEFSKIITTVRPTIIAIGFQEDVKPGSFFHSNLLPTEMQQLGYDLFSRENMMGFGKTTFTGIKNNDVFARGLRLSVYTRSDASSYFRQDYPNQIYASGVFRNKGAICIYITLPGESRLAIINTHFPFDAESVANSVQQQNYSYRLAGVEAQNNFFNEFYRRLVQTSPANPDYVIVMGDLNYRMIPFRNWSARETGESILENPELHRSYDELTLSIRNQQVPEMMEGVGNIGPTFAPTCKMKKNRDNSDDRVYLEEYNIGKYDARVPSYCDRILYKSYTKTRLVCLYYDRFDYGIMNQSDHAGVYGIFSFETPSQGDEPHISDEGWEII